MEVVRRGACVIENEDPPFGRWWELNENRKNIKFGTLNRHKVGQIRSYRAVDKWIRCGILRSFI